MKTKYVGQLVVGVALASIIYASYTLKVTQKDLPFDKKSETAKSMLGVGMFTLVVGGIILLA